MKNEIKKIFEKIKKDYKLDINWKTLFKEKNLYCFYGQNDEISIFDYKEHFVIHINIDEKILAFEKGCF